MDKKAQWSLVAAAWVLVLGLIAMGVVALLRFTGAPASPAPEGAAAAQSLGQAAGQVVPARAICPVDHAEVVVGPDTPRVNYDGTTYYFCATKDAMGRTHKELFLMDPKLYLSGVSSYAVTATPTTAQAAASQASAVAPVPVSPSPAPARN